MTGNFLPEFRGLVSVGWLIFTAIMLGWGYGAWLSMPLFYQMRKERNKDNYPSLSMDYEYEYGPGYTTRRKYTTETDWLRKTSAGEAFFCSLVWPCIIPTKFVWKHTLNHITAADRKQLELEDARRIVAEYEAQQKAEFDKELSVPSPKRRKKWAQQ